MKAEISLGPGDRVDATIDEHVISTDQDGSRPAPFDLFLASIGTCSGIYVSRFCRQRGLPTDGIHIVQVASRDAETGLVTKIDLDVKLPSDFPRRYHDAVIRAAGLCAVKKLLDAPPEIEVRVSGTRSEATRGC